MGNPGRQYETTRHNAGFMALDLLARELGVDRINQAKHRALYTFCQKDGKTLLLAKPQTFMNLSGEAVRDLAQTFQVPPEHIVVLYDDISLPSGRLRVRRSGSAGGHNGIKNIIYQLSSDQFPRVKIGVGAPQKGEEDLKDFVLDTVDSDAYEGIKRAPEAALTLIFQGVDAAMQAFNGAPPAPKE
nr:aminoacyl-tRNA hydrolase [Intestinimonas butyriciproducens]